MPENRPHIQVTAALIIQGNEVLISKRRSRDSVEVWEFPGGKQEPYETLEECLVREIEEELKLKIAVNRSFMNVIHVYGEFSLTLHAFICKVLSGLPEAVGCEAFAWVKPEELQHYSLLPPDRIISRNITNASIPELFEAFGVNK